jgi:hypothetical protein
MILELEKPFNAFEEQRVGLLSKLSALSKEQLHFKPAPDSWSIVETLHHLYLSELGTYQYMRKKMQVIENLPFSGYKHAIKMFLLKMFLRSDKKFKVPGNARVHPTGDVSLGDLTEQWNHLRDNLAQLLDTFDVKSARKLVFRHPVIGYINVHQTLEFLQEHFNHHLKQLERIKKHPAFPKAGAIV